MPVLFCSYAHSQELLGRSVVRLRSPQVLRPYMAEGSYEFSRYGGLGRKPIGPVPVVRLRRGYISREVPR